MKTRKIIISALLSLSAAGAIAPAVATFTPAVAAVASAPATPNTWYHM
jgi:hypothetical protein